MAKQSVTTLPPPLPKHRPEVFAKLDYALSYLETHQNVNLYDAAGGIRALGSMIFKNNGRGSDDGLSGSDVEGIGLAIMSLGRYVESIVEGLETEFSTMRNDIAGLGGEG